MGGCALRQAVGETFDVAQDKPAEPSRRRIADRFPGLNSPAAMPGFITAGIAVLFRKGDAAQLVPVAGIHFVEHPFFGDKELVRLELGSFAEMNG